MGNNIIEWIFLIGHLCGGGDQGRLLLQEQLHHIRLVGLGRQVDLVQKMSKDEFLHFSTFLGYEFDARPWGKALCAMIFFREIVMFFS